MATLLAEIYGPDAASRRAVAEHVKSIFHSVPFIVDVDDMARSIDSLLVVDLLKSERRILRRFMGPEGLEHFVAHHDAGAGQTLRRAAGF